VNSWPRTDLTEIRKKHLRFFEFINKLLRFVPKFLPEGKLTIQNRNEMSYYAAVLTLFSKSCKTLRAIRLLCLAGLSSDANALLRPLLECLISMLYLSQDDKGEKGDQYFAFCHMQAQKTLNALRANPVLNDMVTDEIEKKIKDQSTAIIGEMGEDEFSRRYRASHWSGESIEAIARKVGLEVIYDLPFRLSSQAIHATDYLDHIEYYDGFRINILPGDRWCKEVLGASIVTFLQILKMVNEAFSLKQDRKLSSFEKRSQLLAKPE
jgi:hypothetical protein